MKNQSHVMFMSTTLKTDDNNNMQDDYIDDTVDDLYIVALYIAAIVPFSCYCRYKCYFLDVCLLI